MVKGAGGLGFTLSGGADTVGGCFVRDIVSGPARDDGRLQPGDQILAVRIKTVLCVDVKGVVFQSLVQSLLCKFRLFRFILHVTKTCKKGEPASVACHVIHFK